MPVNDVALIRICRTSDRYGFQILKSETLHSEVQNLSIKRKTYTMNESHLMLLEIR